MQLAGQNNRGQWQPSSEWGGSGAAAAVGAKQCPLKGRWEAESEAARPRPLAGFENCEGSGTFPPQGKGRRTIDQKSNQGWEAAKSRRTLRQCDQKRICHPHE